MHFCQISSHAHCLAHLYRSFYTIFFFTSEKNNAWGCLNVRVIKYPLRRSRSLLECLILCFLCQISSSNICRSIDLDFSKIWSKNLIRLHWGSQKVLWNNLGNVSDIVFVVIKFSANNKLNIATPYQDVSCELVMISLFNQRI